MKTTLANIMCPWVIVIASIDCYYIGVYAGSGCARIQNVNFKIQDALYIIHNRRKYWEFPLNYHLNHGRTGQRRYIFGIPVRRFGPLTRLTRLSHALSSNLRTDVRARDVGGSLRRREFDASTGKK